MSFNEKPGSGGVDLPKETEVYIPPKFSLTPPTVPVTTNPEKPADPTPPPSVTEESNGPNSHTLALMATRTYFPSAQTMQVSPASAINSQEKLSETQRNISADGKPIPICYGHAQVGGNVFALDYTDGVWTVGYIVCLGEIQEYLNVFLNKELPDAGVTINYYTGTKTQTADPLLAAKISGYSDTLIITDPIEEDMGVAYIVLQYNESIYSDWPEVLVEINGKKVKDYRHSKNRSVVTTLGASSAKRQTAVKDFIRGDFEFAVNWEFSPLANSNYCLVSPSWTTRLEFGATHAVVLLDGVASYYTLPLLGYNYGDMIRIGIERKGSDYILKMDGKYKETHTSLPDIEFENDRTIHSSVSRMTHADLQITNFARNPIFTDDFNRSAENLSDNSYWRWDGNGTESSVQIVNNALEVTSSSPSGFIAPDTYTPDHFIEFDIYDTSHANPYSFLCLRMVDINNFVGVRYFSGNWQIYQRVAGAWSALFASSGATTIDGDTARFELIGLNAKLFLNETEIISTTITTSALDSNTNVGLFNEHDSTDAFIDNFSCGPVTFTDDFNRANENLSVAEGWTWDGLGVEAEAKVVSNQVHLFFVSSPSGFIAPSTGSADHYIQWDQVEISASPTAYSMLGLRFADRDNFICCRYSEENWEIWECLSGAFTQLFLYPDSPVSGDTMKFSVIGNNVTLSKNGTIIVRAACSISDLERNTSPGFANWHISSGAWIDNVETGAEISPRKDRQYPMDEGAGSVLYEKLNSGYDLGLESWYYWRDTPQTYYISDSSHGVTGSLDSTITLTADFSVEWDGINQSTGRVWSTVNADAGATDYIQLFGSDHGSNPNQIRVRINSISYDFTPSPSLIDDQEYTAKVERIGTDLSLYIDGVLVSTIASVDTSDFLIDLILSGVEKDIAFGNITITDISTPEIWQYNLGEGTGIVCVDSHGSGNDLTFTLTDGTWTIPDKVVSFSKNPALFIADLETHPLYGNNRSVNDFSVIATQDYCDDDSIGETRREAFLTINDAKETDEWIEVLKTYASCFIVYRGDEMVLIPDKATDVIANVTESDFIQGSIRISKKDNTEIPTVIRAWYTDKSQNKWRERLSDPAEAAGVAAGTTERIESRIRLTGIDRHSQANREIIERLNKLTLSDLVVEWESFDDGMLFEKGDVISISSSYGLSDKKIKLTSAPSQTSQGRWSQKATEYDVAFYSDEVVSEPTWTDTNLPVHSAADAPTNLILSETTQEYQNEKFTSVIDISWTVPAQNTFIIGYSVTVKETATDKIVFSAIKAGTSATTSPLKELIPYTVEVFGVTPLFPSQGAVLSGSYTIIGKSAIPDAPLYITVIELGGIIRCSWPASTDIDVSRYELRWAAITETWEDGTVLDTPDGLTHNTKNIPPGTWRMFIKSIDSIKQVSTTATWADFTVTLDNDAFIVGAQDPATGGRNLILYSEELDNRTATGITITQNAVANPFSTILSAEEITEDTSTGWHWAQTERENIFNENNTEYTVSCYFKRGAGTRYFVIAGFWLARCVFDPETGTVSYISDAGNSAGMEYISDDWWRCWITGTTTGVNGIIRYGMGAESTGSTYTGDGSSSVYIWGAQIEKGKQLTPYTPTYRNYGPVIFHDDFNRADENLSDATGWTWDGTYTETNAQLVSNGVEVNGAWPTEQAGYKAPDTYSADHYIEYSAWDVLAASQHSFVGVRFIDSQNFIGTRYYGGSWELYTKIAGGYLFYGSFADTPTNGDIIRISVVGLDAEVLLNGTQIISATVASSVLDSVTTAGFAAIHTSTGKWIDNVIVNANHKLHAIEEQRGTATIEHYSDSEETWDDLFGSTALTSFPNKLASYMTNPATSFWHSGELDLLENKTGTFQSFMVYTDITGAAVLEMGLKLEDGSYVWGATSQQGTARYIQMRLRSTGIFKVETPDGYIRVNVNSRSEYGTVTTNGQTFFDDFNRPNENLSVSSNWTWDGNGTDANTTVTTNAIVHVEGGTSGYLAPDIGTPDHYIEWNHTTVLASNSLICVRMIDALNYIGAWWSATQWIIYACIAGGYTGLATSAVITKTAGDLMRLEIIGDIATIYQNGTSILSVNISAYNGWLATITTVGINPRVGGINPWIDNVRIGRAGPKTVTLTNQYAAAKSIVLTPQGTENRATTYDNIIVGAGINSFDVYAFDEDGYSVSNEVKYLWEGV